MRIVYHSPRFSEDLDFNSKLDISKLENLVESTLELLDKDNINCEILESKMTSGGYLGIIKINGLNTSLEISNRKDSTGEVNTIIGDFTIPYNLYSLTRDDLISEKIEALLSRSKPRDFYDLYFMLRSNLILQKHKKQGVEIINLIKSTKINFEKELKIFLPKSQWAVIGDFRNILLREFQNNF